MGGVTIRSGGRRAFEHVLQAAHAQAERKEIQRLISSIKQVGCTFWGQNAQHVCQAGTSVPFSLAAATGLCSMGQSMVQSMACWLVVTEPNRDVLTCCTPRVIATSVSHIAPGFCVAQIQAQLVCAASRGAC